MQPFLKENFKVYSSDDFNNVIAGVPENQKASLLRVIDGRLRMYIEENYYLDIDHSSTFFLQVSRSFTPQTRRTKRYHLFDFPFEKEDIDEELNDDFVERLQNGYLGYFVIRSEQPKLLGRTFIIPPRNNSQNSFISTKVKIKANLNGIPLQVECCPYITQDKRVMACATASIWMSGSVLSKKYNNPQYQTSEITALALSLSRPYGPSIGGRGLGVEEQLKALTSMGYDPLAWECPSKKKLNEVICSYTDSGIPPILNIAFSSDGNAVRNHAITAMGYTLENNSGIAHEQNGNYILTDIDKKVYKISDFVSKIIVNDDSNGIYLDASLEAQNLRTNVNFQLQTTLSGCCQAVIVPTPTRIWSSAISITEHSVSALSQFVGLNSESNQTKPAYEKPIVVKTFLIESNKYKEHWLSLKEDYSELSDLYRRMSMPKYVWISEILYLEDCLLRHFNEIPVQGEVIYDATLPDDSGDDIRFRQYLCMHIKEVVGVNCLENNELKFRPVRLLNDHRPYRSAINN